MYEKPVSRAPDPGSWFRAKIVIEERGGECLRKRRDESYAGGNSAERTSDRNGGVVGWQRLAWRFRESDTDAGTAVGSTLALGEVG